MMNFKLFYLLFCLLTFTSASHDTISIEVSCEDIGISVKMVFKRPFEGIVYSKGFYDDPACRYIPSHHETYKMTTFMIPSNKCGTQVVSGDNSIVNTIIVQQSPVLETSSDSVHNVSCNNRVFEERLLSSSAIHVSGRSAENFHFSDEGIKIWMSVKMGTDPFSTTEVNTVRVGDQLTVVIYANDGGRNYGLRVKNCIAHDEKFINGNTTLFQLADTSGCSVRPDLLTSFNVTRHTNGLSDIIAYSRMTAFRFTGKDFLHLSCGVQLCKSDCPMYCLSSHVGSFNYDSTRIVEKRSIPDETSTLSNSRFDNRQLMKTTINALAKRLMATRKFSQILKDDASLMRLLSDQENHVYLDETPVFEEEPGQTTLIDTNFLDQDNSTKKGTTEVLTTMKNLQHQNDSTKLFTINDLEDLAELTTIKNVQQEDLAELTTIKDIQQEDIAEVTTIKDIQQEDIAELITITNIQQEDITEMITIKDLQQEDIEELTTIKYFQQEDIEELSTIKDLHQEDLAELITTRNLHQNLTKEITTLNQQKHRVLTEFAKEWTGHATEHLEKVDGFDNIEKRDKYMYNVTKVFFVNTRGDKNANEEVKVNPYCFPKIKFSLVAGLLSFFLFCLILVVLCMSIYIKREKKKHRIDSFLLYNFQ